MNTPIQELIERLKEKRDASTNRDFRGTYSIAIRCATELLEKEKRMVIDAFDKGNIAGYIQGRNDRPENELGEDYYNRTFKNDKP